MLDDDVKMDALPDINILKSIVTMEDKIDLERKGNQSVQDHLYVRLMAFGNGTLSALYDRSDWFYRRQMVLQVKNTWCYEKIFRSRRTDTGNGAGTD